MIKVLDKYKDWSRQPLGYSFNRVFVFVSVIYLLSTLYDFSLTYLTFRLDSDGFFNNEISFIIKNALVGEPFSFVLIVVLTMSPLIAVYGLNVYTVRRYGMQVKEMRLCFFFINCISAIHIFGGFTNFFHLINIGV